MAYQTPHGQELCIRVVGVDEARERPHVHPVVCIDCQADGMEGEGDDQRAHG